MRKKKKKMVMMICLSIATLLALTLAIVIPTTLKSVAKERAEIARQAEIRRELKEASELEKKEMAKAKQAQAIADAKASAEEARLLAEQKVAEEAAQAEAERLAAEEAALAAEEAQSEVVYEEPYYEDTYYEEPVYEETFSYGGNLGNIGRLYIPALGISVALNTGDDYQGITDAWDSAMWIDFGSAVLVADHCNQEFASLPGSYVGMSGQIDFWDGTRYLTCIDIANGYNDGCSVTIDGQYFDEMYPGCIVMYTCTYDWNHVFVSAWQ